MKYLIILMFILMSACQEKSGDSSSLPCESLNIVGSWETIPAPKQYLNLKTSCEGNFLIDNCNSEFDFSEDQNDYYWIDVTYVDRPIGCLAQNKRHSCYIAVGNNDVLTVNCGGGNLEMIRSN